MPTYRFTPICRAAVALTVLVGAGSLCEAGLDDEQALSATSEKKQEVDEEIPADAETSTFVRLGFQSAYVVPSTDFVRGDNRTGEPIEWGTALRAELGWQASGSEDWQHLYRFPSYGVGVYAANFGSDELGTPVGIYGFFTWPFASLSSRAELSTDLAFGATFGWEPYDPETNPYNRAISSSATFYTDWGLFVRYFLTKRIDVYAGASFTHFSNGSIRAPNAGLNTLSPVAGLQYRFADRRTPPERRPTPKIESHWGTAVWGSGGSKSIEVPADDPNLEDAGQRQSFGVANVGTTLLYRLHPMSTLRGGVDLTYDGSANARLEGSHADKRGVGLYAGYQQEIGKFSILVDAGYYVWRGRTDELVPAAYQRIGWDYRFLGNVFAGIHVRFVDFRRADFMEWTIGYRFD